MLIIMNDVYGLILIMNHEKLDGRADMEVLLICLQDEGQYTTVTIEYDKHVTHLFFAPLTSSKFSRRYGYALIIESSYKNNAERCR